MTLNRSKASCVACGHPREDHVPKGHPFEPRDDGRVSQWAINRQNERLRPVLNVFAQKSK